MPRSTIRFHKGSRASSGAGSDSQAAAADNGPLPCGPLPFVGFSYDLCVRRPSRRQIRALIEAPFGAHTEKDRLPEKRCHTRINDHGLVICRWRLAFRANTGHPTLRGQNLFPNPKWTAAPGHAAALGRLLRLKSKTCFLHFGCMTRPDYWGMAFIITRLSRLKRICSRSVNNNARLPDTQTWQAIPRRQMPLSHRRLRGFDPRHRAGWHRDSPSSVGSKFAARDGRI